MNNLCFKVESILWAKQGKSLRQQESQEHTKPGSIQCHIAQQRTKTILSQKSNRRQKQNGPLNIIRNKLVDRMFAVVKRQTTYQEVLNIAA
jgi:hypothetical protein